LSYSLYRLLESLCFYFTIFDKIKAKFVQNPKRLHDVINSNNVNARASEKKQFNSIKRPARKLNQSVASTGAVER
jgi:hypothetical protein